MRRSDVVFRWVSGRTTRLASGVAVGVLAVTTLGGCVDDDPDPPRSGTAPSDRAPVDLARLTRSGVGVRAAGCSLVDQLGSGIAIGDATTVVTAAHTVAGARELTVETFDGRSIPAELAAFDPARDLAVLSTDTPIAAGDDAGLELADVTRGPAKVVVWDPDDGVTAADVEVTRRLAITIEDIYVENDVRRSGLEVSGEIVVGDSGAAVVDRTGAVIGIVYAASRERDLVGFAVDRTEVDAVLAAAADSESTGVDVDRGRCI